MAQENLSDYEFTNYSVQDGIIDNGVQSIYQDNEGYLWIGTGRGVDRYDGKRFLHMIDKEQAEGKLPFYKIRCITETNGIIWIGTTGDGLVKYDKKKKKFTYFSFEPQKNSISSNFIWSFQKIAENELLICTSKGENRFNIENEYFDIVPHLSKYVFNSFLLDSQKRLWGASSSGLYLFSRHPLAPTEYNLKKYFNISEKILNICQIVEEPNTGGKVLWMASRKHLYRLNIINHSSQSFSIDRFEKSLHPHQYIRVLQFDSDGNLWVGTEGSLGILKKAEKDFRYISLANKNKSSEGFIGNSILSIIQDKA
ncbi:MAG: hypothetical protein K8H86_12545, partial [Ignavibacteriaceae bacterium]|nr:hypothetical protein [Ignavibacteriaceae bacterium]